MEPILKTEGIVLQSIAFKEYDRILTLFTPLGLLKIFARIHKHSYLQLSALTSPLTRAEFCYVKGSKELHRLREGSLLNQHLRIRETYESLQAAHTMLRALYASQFPGKTSPDLYSLFSLFLELLPEVKNPQALESVFLLKILKHEGVLELQSPITASFRFAGERYLNKQDAPEGAIELTEEEETQLVEFSLCRSRLQLIHFSIDSSLQQKIAGLFKQTYE